MQPAMVKRFRHFQSDKSAADHHCMTRFSFVDEGGDSVHVRYVAQGENMRQSCAGDGRHDWLRALAQDEFVERHVALTTIRCLDANGFRGAVDRKNFMVDVRPDARTLPKSFRCHDYQLGAVINFTGDEIREATVGEGNVRSALKNLDVGIFINPAAFGGGRSEEHTSE